MKKNFIFAFFILMTLSLPSKAMITTEESVSQEIIHNQGYSSEMARLVDIRCHQAAATMPSINDSEPEYYKKFNWVRKFFIYADPSLDDGSFMRHDLHV